MVVEIQKKKYLIIPLFLGIIAALLYNRIPFLYFAALIAGVGLTVLSIYNIKFGILSVIVAMPFLPDEFTLLLIIFIVFIFILNHVFGKGYSIDKSFVNIPLAIFVLAIIIATVTSIDPKGSFRDLAIHLSAIGLLVVIVNGINNKNDLNLILTSYVFTATLVALYGIYQYFVGVELDPAWVDATNNPEITTRVFSVFGNPNILAEYLIMAIPTSIALFWNTKKLIKKIIFMLTTMVLSVTLLMTLSRGGWLGIAFGIFIFILLVEKKLFLLSIPVGIASIFVIPDSIMSRIMTIGSLTDSSNAYRIKIWQITTDIIRDHWEAGVGFGYIPFKKTFETYIRTMPIYHAHNTYLEIAAEMGIVGLVLFAILIFVLYKYGVLNAVKSNDKYIKTISAGLLAGISSLLFHGIVEHVLYIPRIIITFWILVAFILVMIKLNESDIRKDSTFNCEKESKIWENQ